MPLSDRGNAEIGHLFYDESRTFNNTIWILVYIDSMKLLCFLDGYFCTKNGKNIYSTVLFQFRSLSLSLSLSHTNNRQTVCLPL